MQHTSVLLKPAISALAIRENGVYVDGTFGRGGHSQAILSYLGDDGLLLAIDKDPEALLAANETPFQCQNFRIHQGSFKDLETFAKREGIEQGVDGVLLDLGVSSPQLDQAHRGFSFIQDGPLDMRMNPDQGLSAAQWLAEVEEETLSGVLKQYGEERFARRIAKAIVTHRESEAFVSTAQLAEVVAKANPAWEKHKHPATRTFQAIRIYVNQELKDLEEALEASLRLLKVGGRLVVISFHSLEDRMVKQFIRKNSRGDPFPKDLPVTQDQLKVKLKKIGGAVKASPEELQANNRARSAVMRVAEKLAD